MSTLVTLPVSQLLPGMRVADRGKIIDVLDHCRFHPSQDYNRVAAGMRWVVWDDGKGKRGGTSVYDIEDHVRVTL